MTVAKSGWNCSALILTAATREAHCCRSWSRQCPDPKSIKLLPSTSTTTPPPAPSTAKTVHRGHDASRDCPSSSSPSAHAKAVVRGLPFSGCVAAPVQPWPHSPPSRLKAMGPALNKRRNRAIRAGSDARGPERLPPSPSLSTLPTFLDAPLISEARAKRWGCRNVSAGTPGVAAT